jgi:hypothetical protein
MTMLRLLKRPLGFVPVLLSAVALAAIALQLARHGTAPQPDENAAAHVWQLVMAAQLPLLAIFAVKWLPEAPKPAAGVLAVQLAAILAAMAPVALLGW